ncbi:30S ribosomal protein S20 [Candidatus Nitrosoglobus terrae]|uniref:30S ribosomal protein S20 n=1 Tax=Candidatus Nitrosoglobus terrae TaxID=1630141 RepID=UPI000BBB3436|nr:30S ribosomal protein S20 [Candidatus Nitrosoglobus terrae]
MANTQQARKRVRQAEEQRAHNKSQLSMMRTYIKKVVKAITSGDKDEAVTAYKAAVPILDRLARKGLIHTNKAARHKSRLNAKVQAIV